MIATELTRVGENLVCEAIPFYARGVSDICYTQNEKLLSSFKKPTKFNDSPPVFW